MILSDVMRRAWTELGDLSIITATGGSATTVVDTNTRYTTDDALMNGTVVVITTTDGLTPQGKFAKITDFVASTKTFTIDTVTDAIGAGDIIGLAKPRIPALHMKQAVNDALRDHIGTISLVDTSLTTVAAQTEYALPVGLKIKKLTDVLIQANTSDADDNGYVSIKGASKVFPAAPGSTGLLVIPDYGSGYKIKIVYEGLHPELTAYNSTVSETIMESLIVAATVDKALTWLVSKRGDSALGTFLLERWNDAKNGISMAKAESPVHRHRKAPKYFMLNQSNISEDVD